MLRYPLEMDGVSTNHCAPSNINIKRMVKNKMSKEIEETLQIHDFRQYLLVCKHDALAKLLIAKGIITEEEYLGNQKRAGKFAVKNHGKEKCEKITEE